MDKPKLRIRDDPERQVRDDIRDFMLLRGWFIKITHGNAFTEGWPDIFACHSSYGQRWIEVKLPDMKGSKFTPAQLRDFPKLIANGSGVWVLTAGNDTEYQKLFAPCNYWMCLETWRK